MEKLNKISIVIPVYNNSGSIIELLNNIEIEFNKNNLNKDSEVILVDDFSKDDSINKMIVYKKSSKLNISIVKLKLNHGQIFAVKLGFFLATGDAVITLSADLQDPTSLISDFFEAYERGYKIVIGVRADRQDGVIRKITSLIAYSVSRLRSPNLPKGGFDCYLISREILDKVLSQHRNTVFIQGVISEFKTPINKIFYTRGTRKHGKSQWSLAKKLFLVWGILTQNSRISSITLIKLTYCGFLFVISLFLSKHIFKDFGISNLVFNLASLVLIYSHSNKKFKKTYKKHDFSNPGMDFYSII